MYDTAKFERYGIEFRIRDERLQIRPAGKVRYFNIDTATATRIINTATNNDPTLLYPDEHDVRAIAREAVANTIAQPGWDDMDVRVAENRAIRKALKDYIRPLYDDNKIYTLLYNNRTIILDKDLKGYQSPLDSLVHDIITKIVFEYELRDYDHPIRLIITDPPAENQLPANVREGNFNCVLSIMKRHVDESLHEKLDKLNEEFFEEGVSDDGFKKIADVCKKNICVYDKSGEKWITYNCRYSKMKTVLISVHNNHATEYDKVSNDINWDAPVTWVSSFSEVPKELRESPYSKIIESKREPIALLAPNIIYKVMFDECASYPKCFTSGGIGKQKFMEQISYLTPTLPTIGDNVSPLLEDIMWEADYHGFYMRNGETKSDNIKYDMKHAYKSFKKSPAYRGIPERLDAVYSFNKHASEFDAWDTHGLMLVDWIMDTKSKIYYEGRQWVPIEIVHYNYKHHNINPYINNIAIALHTFDFNIDHFTNDQFRNFIGKCAQYRSPAERWITTDINEHLRSGYLLHKASRLIAMYTVDCTPTASGSCSGTPTTTDGTICTKYITEYDADKIPWNCIPVALYVKAHQRFMLFNKINELHELGVVPVYVAVDSIEIDKNSPDVSHLFNDPSRWRREDIKKPLFSEYGAIPRDYPQYHEATPWEERTTLSQLLHISGAAGCGKSYWINKMKKEYTDAILTATTYQALQQLEKDTKKTYHTVFVLGNMRPVPITPASIYLIDECSMLNSWDLMTIDRKLRELYNTWKPFGGRYIILVGDLKQLPPVKGDSIDNCQEGQDIYKLFKVVELTHNYRQQDDKPFNDLLNTMRNPMTTQQAREIMNTLNTRVLPLPDDYDLYMVSINDKVSKINKEKYNNDFKAQHKILSTANIKLENGFIANGSLGVVTEDGKARFGDLVCPIRAVFNLAAAITIHRAQGMTCRGNIILDPDRLFDKNHLYVALSRATKLSNVYLTSPIDIRTMSKTCVVT